MTELFDAELLKDLRGLGEYQDFRFSFGIHMSLVSSVSQPLMDKCEVERNPISLAAGKLVGDAHLKCCIQMYYSLALTTKGFESGLRAWQLDVGEWERASGTVLTDAVKYTVMVNMAPIFLRNSLQLGTYPNSAALRAALLQWCYSSRSFGANPTVAAGNVTSADDDRMQVDSLKKGKGKEKGKPHNQKGNRPTSTTNTSSTDINTCKNCGRTGHWAKGCWRPGGGAYDICTSNNSNPQKGSHSHKKGKGKGKHVDVVETNQPSDTATTAASTVSYPSQTPCTIG